MELFSFILLFTKRRNNRSFWLRKGVREYLNDKEDSFQLKKQKQLEEKKTQTGRNKVELEERRIQLEE